MTPNRGKAGGKVRAVMKFGGRGMGKCKAGWDATASFLKDNPGKKSLILTPNSHAKLYRKLRSTLPKEMRDRLTIKTPKKISLAEARKMEAVRTLKAMKGFHFWGEVLPLRPLRSRGRRGSKSPHK
jgi:bifunctional DNA-binding transcriptional regulator/antitoxin component of YhaV-PrlF toxin-antitoxin module